MYDVFDNPEFSEQMDMQKYVLRKLTDDVFDGLHPNGIDEGYTVVGTFREGPIVGKRFEISGSRLSDYLITSTVTEIVDHETFKTKNSTYSLVPYED